MKIDFTPEEFWKRFPYHNDCNGDPRLVGHPALLNPMVERVSGSRLEMFSSHRKQALMLKGAELPQIISGYEMEEGKYTFNETRRNEDVVIKALIPRYQNIPGMKNENSPWVTVIYHGCQSKQYGYFNIPQYHLCTDGFGFRYKKCTGVKVNQYLSQEEVVACSSAIEGNQYKYGVNLNTVYMTVQQVVEDAVWISDRAAKAMESEEYRRIILDISRDMRPLSRNPAGEEIKIFPDIGECVGDDGVLCAFRPTNYTFCDSDLNEESLSTMNRLTDNVRIIKPGSQILNLEFLVKGSIHHNSNWAQVDRYHNATLHYWREIVNFYQEHLKNEPITRELNTLVTQGIKFLIGHGQRIAHFDDGLGSRTELHGWNDRPVEFIQAVVTYRKKRKVSIGFKITDRNGAKGVISQISPLEEMPRDEYGNYADIVIDPTAVCARNNPSQLFETGINHISEIVKRRIVKEAETDMEQAFSTLLEYLNDIRPNYARLVEETHPTLLDKKKLLKWIKENFIVLHIPPFYNGLSLEHLGHLFKKWNAEPTHLRWIQRDENGQTIKVVSEQKSIIGKKYILCLQKIPHSHAPGMAYVSHYGSPSEPPSSEKNKKPVSEKPVRFGEDEVRITIGAVGWETTKRFTSLLGTSTRGAQELVYQAMTNETPTNIDRINLTNKELRDTDGNIAMYHHMMRIMGVDSLHTKVTPEDMEYVENQILQDEEEDEDG